MSTNHERALAQSQPGGPDPATALSVFLERGRDLVRSVGAGELAAKAAEIVIVDDPSFAAAGELRSALKAAQNAAETRFKKLRDPLNTLRNEIIGLENDVVGPIERAVKGLDGKTTTYRQEQIRLAEEKRRQEEAVARKIEEDRRLKEAEAAVANGTPHEEALAVMDEPLMPVLAPSAPVVPKVPGQAYVDIWSAEVFDLKALQRFVAANPLQSNLTLANLPALNGMAKSTKGPSPIPGVKFVCKQTVRGRAAQ
jgi:hypothetical protein